MFALQIIGVIVFLLGVIVMTIASIGLMRFKNNFTLLHIASLSDMFGVPLAMIGMTLLLLSQEVYSLAMKVFLLVMLLFICVPIGGYIVAKIIYFIDHENHKTSR